MSGIGEIVKLEIFHCDTYQKINEIMEFFCIPYLISWKNRASPRNSLIYIVAPKPYELQSIKNDITYARYGVN